MVASSSASGSMSWAPYTWPALGHWRSLDTSRTKAGSSGYFPLLIHTALSSLSSKRVPYVSASSAMLLKLLFKQHILSIILRFPLLRGYSLVCPITRSQIHLLRDQPQGLAERLLFSPISKCKTLYDSSQYFSLCFGFFQGPSIAVFHMAQLVLLWPQFHRMNVVLVPSLTWVTLASQEEVKNGPALSAPPRMAC